jgi:tetratricopeptide (TPR) repeat protein
MIRLHLLAVALIVAGTACAPGAEGGAPSLRLRVNGSLRAEVTPGTPLVFEVTLFDQRAREARDRRLANDVIAADIDRRLQAGELAPREAERRRKALAPPAEEPVPFRIRLEGTAVTLFAAPGSPEGKLPWEPREAPRRGPGEVELDAETTAGTSFVVGPEELGGAGGTWLVAARYRGPAGDRAWSGEATSNPVEVRVVQEPETATAQIRRALGTARYHSVLGSHDAALTAVRQALAIEPKYPESLMLLGEVLEAGADLRGALEAYGEALSQMRKHQPGETHDVIRERMRTVRRKMDEDR